MVLAGLPLVGKRGAVWPRRLAGGCAARLHVRPSRPLRIWISYEENHPMPAEVGKPAPDFTLKDVDNNEVSLSSLKGKKTVIMFVPFPWTGICDTESCALRDDHGFAN